MSQRHTQLLSAYLGNLVEHYDTALFSFLIPFLAPLIFPKHEPITALIYSYAIIPFGMIARPIGALIFGYIGDVFGRQRALFITLAGMAFVTGSIALTPTYLQVGIWAPILFYLGRVLQNFFAAGESIGGAIFFLENSSEKKRDILSGFYDTSTMGGHFLASFGVFLLSSSQTIESGWRLLYLFGCLTALFGFYLRRSSPSQETLPRIRVSIKDLVWRNRKALLIITLISGFARANYDMALVLMNGFIPLVTTLTKSEVMRINSYLIIFDFSLLPFFGWVASKISRERLMLYASFAVIFTSIPLLALLEGGSLVGVILVRIVFVMIGVAFFAPFHAWTQQIVPKEGRYSVISLGYALGSKLIGSPTAALSLWLYKVTGLVWSLSWYWIILAIASSVIVSRSRRPVIAT